MDTLKNEILKLIQLKTEGDYWDFKEKHHSNDNHGKQSLLHDIICMSNCTYDGDKYIIYGVSDDGNIIGILNNDFRRTQKQLTDFVYGKSFANGNIPKVELETIKFDNKVVDILIIKNSNKCPFYLDNDFMSIKKYHIYTRRNDQNTPLNISEDYFTQEEIWKKHFGIGNIGTDSVIEAVNLISNVKQIQSENNDLKKEIDDAIKVLENI